MWCLHHHIFINHWLSTRILFLVPCRFTEIFKYSKHHWTWPLYPLTHCGLVTAYGVGDLCQHWFRQCLGAWWHQAIAWTMLTDHQWGRVAFNSGQLHRKFPRYWFLILFSKSLIQDDSRREQQVNSSPPGQNGHHFADNIFRCIFVNEKSCIFIEISFKFVPKGPTDNNLALV